MIVFEQNLQRFIVFHDLCPTPIWPSQLKSKIFVNKNVSKEISVEGKWYIGEEQKLKKYFFVKTNIIHKREKNCYQS